MIEHTQPLLSMQTTNHTHNANTIEYKNFMEDYKDFIHMIGYYLAGDSEWRRVAYKEIPYSFEKGESTYNYRIVKFLSILLKTTQRKMSVEHFSEPLDSTKLKLANRWWLIGLDDETTTAAIANVFAMWLSMETKSYPTLVLQEGLMNALGRAPPNDYNSFAVRFMEIFFHYELSPNLVQ